MCPVRTWNTSRPPASIPPTAPALRQRRQLAGHINVLAGFAPDRSTAFPCGTEPTTTMSA